MSGSRVTGIVPRAGRARHHCRGRSDGVELLEGGPRGEVDGGGERLELLIGRHDVGVAVALAAGPLGVDGLGGEEAGPVEVEIGREAFWVKSLTRWGGALGMWP